MKHTNTYSTRNMDTAPDQPEPSLEQSESNIIRQLEPDDIPMKVSSNPQTEEEEIMTQLSIETEFAAMERSRNIQV